MFHTEKAIRDELLQSLWQQGANPLSPTEGDYLHTYIREAGGEVPCRRTLIPCNISFFSGLMRVGGGAHTYICASSTSSSKNII